MDDPNAYILKQYLDKVDRKLEDYTLKDIKHLCEQIENCKDCPLFDESEYIKYEYAISALTCKLHCVPEQWGL